MTDIEALRARMREAAEEATPGPWEWHTSCSWKRLYQAEGRKPARVIEPYVCSDGHPDISVSKEDMDYLALASPANVKALDAEITRLRDDLDRVTRERDEAGKTPEVLRLIARAEAAEAAIAKRDEEVARLRRVLAEARDAMQAWQGYASDYFLDKHDAAGDLAKIDQALTKEPTNAE